MKSLAIPLALLLWATPAAARVESIIALGSPSQPVTPPSPAVPKPDRASQPPGATEPPGNAAALDPSTPSTAEPKEKKKPVCYTAPYTQLVSAIYTVGEPAAPGEAPPAVLFATAEVKDLISGAAVLTGDPGTLIQYWADKNYIRRFDFADPGRDGVVSINLGPWFAIVDYEQSRTDSQQIQTFYFDTNNTLKFVAEVLVREQLQRQVCK